MHVPACQLILIGWRILMHTDVTDAWWVVTLLHAQWGFVHNVESTRRPCSLLLCARLHSKWMCCHIDSHTRVWRLSGTEGCSTTCITGKLARQPVGCRYNTSTTTPSFPRGSLCSVFFSFISLISPSFSPPPHSPPPPCHHFRFPVHLCARACIWHLSGGLRVMPWSCHKLGHRSM